MRQDVAGNGDNYLRLLPFLTRRANDRHLRTRLRRSSDGKSAALLCPSRIYLKGGCGSCPPQSVSQLLTSGCCPARAKPLGRCRRLVEEADLKTAEEVFGDTRNPAEVVPVSLPECEDYGRLVAGKLLAQYAKSPHFPTMLRSLLPRLRPKRQRRSQQARRCGVPRAT